MEEEDIRRLIKIRRRVISKMERYDSSWRSWNIKVILRRRIKKELRVIRKNIKIHKIKKSCSIRRSLNRVFYQHIRSNRQNKAIRIIIGTLRIDWRKRKIYLS